MRRSMPASSCLQIGRRSWGWRRWDIRSPMAKSKAAERLGATAEPFGVAGELKVLCAQTISPMSVPTA